MSRFFDKLEKLEVLMIIFAIIVCLFGLVVMHGWPKEDWAFGWTALAAIGGLVAGFGAFYAAYVALQIADKARSDKAEEDAAKRGVYEVIFLGAYASVYDDIVQLKNSVCKIRSAGSEYTATIESAFFSLVSRKDFFPIDGFIENTENAIYFSASDMRSLAEMIGALRVVKTSVIPDLIKHLTTRGHHAQSFDGVGVLSKTLSQPHDEMLRLCSRLDAQLISIIRLSCAIGFLRAHIPNDLCQKLK